MVKMAVFLKHLKPKQISHACKILTTAQARQAHFFINSTPGSYPKTKEERERAAKKYNLLPEEYEPYPENENPIGDYPKLPLQSVDSKDPYHPWDWREFRRDYNEPVPREIMMLVPEGITTKPREFTILKGLCIYFSLISASLLCFFCLTWFRLIHPACEKQYPTPGVVHYTFDHLSDEEWEKLKAQNRMKECIEKCKNPEL